MSKSHTDCLAVLLDNEIKYDRWFTIGDIFFIGFKNELEENEINKLKSLFLHGDYFNLYKTFSFDMREQPFTSPLSITRKSIKVYSKSEIEEKKKEIKQIENLFSL